MSHIKIKEFSLKNNSKIIIRTAVPDDAKELIDLKREIMMEKKFMIHEIDELRETVKGEAQKIRKFRKSPGKIFIAAEIENEIAGFVNFANWDTRKTKHTGFLSIYIRKKYRGIGIGRILISELINWAKQNKIIHKMSLAVFGSNKNAIALYLKMGFKIEGICPKDVKINGKYLDSVFMYIFTS